MVANLCRSSNCEYERLANVPLQSMADLFEIVVNQLDINIGTMYLGANTVIVKSPKFNGKQRCEYR